VLLESTRLVSRQRVVELPGDQLHELVAREVVDRWGHDAGAVTMARCLRSRTQAHAGPWRSLDGAVPAGSSRSTRAHCTRRPTTSRRCRAG
jgi:hypothetical protein